MTANLGPDDDRPGGDAVDRAIDDALGAELGGGPRNLRAHVLARLEEPVEDRPSRLFVFLRPAMLPVAGALLIVVGVAFSWWRADYQLDRAGASRGRADAGGVARPQASGQAAANAPTPIEAPARVVEIPAAPPAAETPARTERPTADAGDRIFAASWLEMDSLSSRRGIAADTVVADEDEAESFLPGAIGGDLGDPIRPIPRPRPIVIPLLVTAPIEDAPPISTLATPVSTLSTDSSSRDQAGPGKLEGVRP